ncbi:endonuclease III [Candidatus Trichorickettsia mobilis]|uniref:endonuclease III n=1 Tax=Candidatus Trichorickettsia mobilis TaxID=1346319 RepID=UPI00293045A1|nr:endonuclease III [Candidatus Trichorickettsia mobilis]
MQVKIVEQIFSELHKHNQNPVTELKYNNNFTLLVAVVLSAQATDLSVNKASSDLFLYYNSPEKMLALGEDGLKNYIKTIGLYHTKAANIIKTCQALIERHNGQVPASFEELIKLPGVGVKTANVILNCAFDQPTIAVDTHVFRVSKRLGLAHAQQHQQVGVELLQVIPLKWQKIAHHLLILHGRYICKARNPDCKNCCIQKYCEYYKKIYSK